MFNIRAFFEGLRIIPKASSTADTAGELEVVSSDNRLRYHDGTSSKIVVLSTSATAIVGQTIDADVNTITNIENADIKVGAAIDAAKIHNGTVSNAEFGYLDGVTSSIQTQLNATVSTTGVATLTNKTIDGDDNTLLDISITSLKTNGAAPNTFISRDGSGIVISTKAVPTGAVVGVSDTQTLTGKTIDGDDNTVQDLPLTAIKTNVTDASKFIVRDASGIPVSNSKDVPAGVVVGTTDTQTLTNKTLTAPVIATISNTGTLTLPTSTDTLVGRATTDTLTNKTLTTPTTDVVTWDDQASTPANPSAGFYKTYFKTDGNLYKLNSSGVEAALAGGGLASSDPSSVKTADYAVLSSDNGKTILVDTTSASITITLPAPVANFKVIVKDIAGNASINNIIILPNGSEKIDNINGYDTLNSNYQAIGYHSNGTDYFRVVVFTGPAPTGLSRGIFGGGNGTVLSVNTLDYVSISTASNATDFGDLTVSRGRLGACSSSTRGVWGGGNDLTLYRNEIDYVTIATLGNATDFGDLSVTRGYDGGCGSSTRGLFGGGYTGANSNVIDYITIATLGNATDFGDLTAARQGPGSCSSPTRALWGGGYTASPSNVIDYVTIASTGNATAFGDLTVARYDLTGTSSSVRGLFIGGFIAAVSNIIDYVTIATLSNATDFGDLISGNTYAGATASQLRAVIGGGSTGPSASDHTDAISYITIASAGNATNFGNLTVSRGATAACSSGHGGL